MSLNGICLGILLFYFSKVIVSVDVALFSQRENVCGTWQPYKEEKCIKIIKTAKYEKESGASVCQSYTETFDTDYSLLRIRNEDEQAFFSKLLFIEKDIKEKVWLEYKVKDNKMAVTAGNDKTNLLDIPVYFNNWAKTDQGEKDGLCVAMLPATNPAEVGQWERANCNELNIVVCERPQPVSMERLQAQYHKQETMLNLLLKHKDISKEAAKEIRNIARGKPVQQSTTYSAGYEASNAIDGNLQTVTHTKTGDSYPWLRIDLLQSHDVRAVAVYQAPNNEVRFHDVSIFVSDIDISTTTPHTYFNPGNDSICADNIGSDSVVDGGWTVYGCKKVVVGRHVSLQITADCKPGRTDCNHPSDRNVAAHKHLLIVREVEVSVLWQVNGAFAVLKI